VHAHRREIARGGLSPSRFYLRRFARIYPLHLATLLFYLALVIALGIIHKPLPNPGRYSTLQFVLNLFMLNALQTSDSLSWNYASWSISAEWIAYLAFPLLILSLRRFSPTGRPMVLAAACGLFLLTYFGSPFLTGAPFIRLLTNFGYLRVIPEFALGMAMYYYFEGRELKFLAHRAAMPAVLTLLAIAAYFHEYLVAILLLAVLLLAGAEAARSSTKRGFLASRTFVYLGQISFALYMVHLPVSTLLFQGTKSFGGHVSFGLVLFGIALAVVTAIAAHHWIEIPVNRFIVSRYANAREDSRAIANPAA